MDTKTLISIIKEDALDKNLGLLYEAKSSRIRRRRKMVIATSTGTGGDAAGKAFEIHVAKHIGHILRGGDNPEAHYPEHFSDESGDSPKDSIMKQRDRLGNALHDQIDDHARRMAHHIVNHLRKRGVQLDETSRVHWTSKPNDLERLTGKKGVKGTADITISHKGKHHGISLKYSTSGTKPSLRSPGIKDLTTMLKADHDHVNSLVSQHDRNVDVAVGNHVGSGAKKEKHARFKALLLGKKSKHARMALEASKSTHRALAQHFGDSFNKLEHEDKVKFIRKMTDAEEQPTIKPYRASYDAKGGSSHITNPTRDFDEVNKTARHYSAEVSGSSVNIFAHHHDGSKRKVTSFGIKNKGSSPFSGLAARVSDITPKKK